VAKLREIGIQPDILICRTEKPLGLEIRQKLSLFCNVPVPAVIEERDVGSSIYELPQMLAKEKLDDIVLKLLSLRSPKRPNGAWSKIVRRLKKPTKRVNIGVVGKYIELQDAYKSVYESLTHGGIANNCGVNIVRLDAEAVERNPRKELARLDGVLVPGGFGGRGIEGKIRAVQYAREHGLPYFGLCLGMQVAVIEFARNVAKLEGANSTEFARRTPHPVIHLMEEQKKITDKGATMRLGSYDCQLTKGTLARAAYGEELVRERHRHRYEFNNAYRGPLTKAGLRLAGVNPKRDLVEIVEVKDHPWFVGVQFHPEFQSKPTRPHPLFAAFVKAAIKKRGKK
jgi:CTP synthase